MVMGGKIFMRAESIPKDEEVEVQLAKQSIEEDMCQMH
jgi:hypothetical protein